MSRERIPTIRTRKEVRKANRSRKLLMLLFLFFITILTILFFHSSLSKVTDIEIVGNAYVERSAIETVLNVEPEDQFFLVRSESVAEHVRGVPGVQSAEVVKTFPGKITITVTEYPAVAWEYDANQSGFVILSNGLRLPRAEGAMPPHLPILSGWDDADPVRLALCAVLAEIPVSSLADVSEILPFPSSSFPDRVKIYTRSKYEVVTAVQYMGEMMEMLDNVIMNLKQTEAGPGTLTMLETITFSAFDEGETDGEGTAEGAAP